MRTSFAARLLPACGLVCLLSGMLLPGMARADTAKEHFDKAVALYNDKKYDQALDEFDAARKISPKDATILNWIGWVNLQQQKYAEARDPLEEAVKLKPNDADVHTNLGNVYFGLNRYEDAASEFKQASKLQPDSADSYYNLGNAYFKLNRLPEAIAADRQAATLNPKDPYMQSNLGYVLQSSGNYAGAVEAYSKATDLLPNKADFWLNLGLANQEWALKAQVKPGAESKKTADEAWAGARRALSHAAQLAPDSYQVHEIYGEVLASTNQDAEAVPQFEKAAELDPKQVNPVYNLGYSETRLGHLDKAAAAYRQALALQPGNRDTLHNLGMVEYRAGNYDEAATTYADLTKQAPEDLPAWINLSLALQHKKDESGAISALEQAVEHGSRGEKLAEVRRALAGYYVRKGDADSLKRAQTQYTESLKDAPRNAEALNGLALIAQKENQYDDAVRLFQSAIAADPNYADAYNNLGVVYEALNKMDQAQDCYRKALHIDPAHVNAKHNLERFTKGKP